MIEPKLQATYEGKPLEVLSDLIQKRQQWLGETYKDAVAATAITALKSIRAITNTYYGKNSIQLTKNDVTIERRTGVHPSFTGKDHKPCFRSGNNPSRNAPRISLGRRYISLVPKSTKDWLNAQVWIVKLSNERLERWKKFPPQFYAIATSYDIVFDYVKRKFSNIANRQAGLARSVLGALMGKLSTRPPANEQAGEHVSKIVRRYGVVNQRDAGNTYSVHVESNLLYALLAVKGRNTGIQNALKSAANKVAGIIKHKVGERLDVDLTTPFPEVKKKR